MVMQSGMRCHSCATHGITRDDTLMILQFTAFFPSPEIRDDTFMRSSVPHKLVTVDAERTGPGALTHLTNTMLLHSLAGARSLVSAASWASCTLMSALREDTRFPITVRTHDGACLALAVVRRLPPCLNIAMFKAMFTMVISDLD